MINKKIVIGMSGGVDSSVSAYLLKEQGYDVYGVTMNIWPQKAEETQIVQDAAMVAEKLGIKHLTVDFEKEFKKEVIQYFISEYEHGRTPNPCVMCNRKIKWEALMNKAKELGIDMIATGHYAKITQYPTTGRFCLSQAQSDRKDQTYVLYNLTQEQLSHTKMLLGSYEKDQVREIAKQIGLKVADKPDSQEICFIPDHDYVSYIENAVGHKFPTGKFVDVAGTILGMHEGIIRYTVGQRKGLGIAFGSPMYVNKINAVRNQVILGTNDDLFHSRLIADNFNFMAVDKIQGEMRFQAKIRYSAKKADCTVRMLEENKVEIIFDVPQRAITPGQAVVLYDGDFVVGGGTILSSKVK
ncbi:MAG: tRNA 2-thiouridine(34) synthase MnmA [Clostridiales bacterium]|nr:tRNA 2-thiouridine(34) synthase MnmA [Clostridiales bacterium]